jgi:hypothetical protein
MPLTIFPVPQVPAGPRRSTAHRFVRAAAAGIVGVLASSSVVLGAAGAAHAATGDYTVQMDAPASVPVEETFNYAGKKKSHLA